LIGLFQDTLTGNPITFKTTEENLCLEVYNDVTLNGAYDSFTNLWAYNTKGFWSAVAISLDPTWGGKWTAFSGSTYQALTLATGIDSTLTLLQIQFAESNPPTTIWPLVYRWSSYDDGNPTAYNPVAITIENGILAAQFSGNSDVFTAWSSNGQWSHFTQGYFRANVFNLKPDFDSKWVYSPTIGTLFSIPHGLDIAPQVVQVFFFTGWGKSDLSCDLELSTRSKS